MELVSTADLSGVVNRHTGRVSPTSGSRYKCSPPDPTCSQETTKRPCVANFGWLSTFVSPVCKVAFVLRVAGVPGEWLSDNTASLLFLCGHDVALPVLLSKALNGRIAEVASLVTSLCTVSVCVCMCVCLCVCVSVCACIGVCAV